LDYCQRWKAKSSGYETSDVFYYDAVMIEALLPAVIRGELSITQKLNLGGPGKPPAPAEGGNMMIMMIEIDKAYNKLSTEDRTVLFYKYAESFDYNTIATEMNLGSEDAARMRHNRAIKKLIIRVGGFRPWSDKDIDDKVSDGTDENPTIPPDDTSHDEHSQGTDED
jgi:hypothetical protein